jgi:putative flippase GtrA
MRIVRYFFVGAAAAAVDIGVFGVGAKLMALPWFPVSCFSFVLATATNYALSVRHVFSSGVRFARHHELLLVFAVSGIGLAINQAALWVLIEKGGWELILAKVAATGIVFFWNYGARRNFIFRPSR